MFAVLLLARGVRHVIERARWTSDHSLRTLAAGIGSALTIVLGVFLALWDAVPSVRFTELLTASALPESSSASPSATSWKTSWPESSSSRAA